MSEIMEGTVYDHFAADLVDRELVTLVLQEYAAPAWEDVLEVDSPEGGRVHDMMMATAVLWRKHGRDVRLICRKVETTETFLWAPSANLGVKTSRKPDKPRESVSALQWLFGWGRGG
jgi:hypothetical protein